MIYIKDEAEKMVPSAEEKEMKEEEIEEKGEDDAGTGEDGADEEQESGQGESEGKKEALPPAKVKMEKDIQLCIDPSEKKQSDGLNLNNEVVRMRKEVKRVRALVIRKLTRQIGTLKKKKGKETEIERNQRRASRLLEEIHVMKGLSPDLVTKTALQKSLNFEQECKNPNSTISDRAIARIATHPQFNKKIEDIKAAVKAFKEERMKGGKQVGKEKMQNKAAKVTPQSPAKKPITAEEKKIDSEEEDDMFTETAGANFMEPEEEKAVNSNATLVCQSKEKPEPKKVRPAPLKSSKVEKKVNLKSLPDVLHKKKDEEESDLELSDEEKEYFDDSTEERFHKQSSQSESDDDDFFVGKVSKFKKKKLKSTEGEKGHEVKTEQTDEVQSKLKEFESRQKSRATSLQSVFCSSLAVSKPGGGSGAGRGRGRDKFRGQGKPWGSGGQKRDFHKQSKFQKEDKGTERHSGSTYSKSDSSEKTFPSDSRGKGRGRDAVTRKKDHRDGGVFSSQAPQQALHPSWEASKKRKEQQGQIMAFQGKKIKFDDDDD